MHGSPESVGGRSLPHVGFAGDDGAADPLLVAALALADSDPCRRPRVLAALHRARLLVPVVARATEWGTTPAGLRHESTAEVSVPLLLDETGTRALMAFTDLAALAAWDSTARPVPVLGPRAAEVALAEHADALVLDVAGARTAVLEKPELRALVEGRAVLVAWADPDLAAQVAGLLDAEPRARTAAFTAAAGADAALVVTVDPPGPGDEDLAAMTRRLAAAVAGLPAVRAGVRGVQVSLRC